MFKVAIIGIRGYDKIYSGFETFVKVLVEKSNKNRLYFYLFSHLHYQQSKINKHNFSTISIPTVNNKYFETFIYSVLSHFYSLFIKTDVILCLGIVNANLICLQRLFGRKVIVNIDGLDWQRKRWNFLGKSYLKLCERMTVLFSHAIICDSRTVMDYFKNKYHLKNVVYIPYGAKIIKRKPGKVLSKFGLIPKKYMYVTGRLTPENAIEDLIIAFKKVKTGFKCVIVGDSVYEDKYKQYLLNLTKTDDRFVFTGFLKRQEYEEICSNSYLYVETKEVGGTHPSLLESMAVGNCVIAKKIGFHEEVLDKNGMYYDNNLKENIEMLLKVPEMVKKIGEKNKLIIRKKFAWKNVVKQYNNILTAG